MGMKAPKTILTDQDPAMSKALEIVMPDIKHCLCIWHILQNALKHVGHVVRDDVGIKSVLFRFMKYVDDEKLFLSQWKDMLAEFDVKENKWLSDLFELKGKWAKAYVKHHWCVGMRTTLLSESFNSQVKRFIISDLYIPEFFKHFERLVSHLRHNEKHVDFDLCNKLLMIQLSSSMIVQAGNIFTRPIFERFQKQFIRSVNAFIGEDIIDEGGELKYTIVVVEGHRSERCVRRIKTTNHLICECGKFEMEGVLCCHVINILREVLHAIKTPKEYICKRWTRLARDETMHDILGNVIEDDPNLQKAVRYKRLCHLASRLNVVAAGSENDYLLVLKNFEDMLSVVDKGKNTTNAPTSNEGNSVDDQNRIPAGLKKKNAWRGQRKSREKPGYEAGSARKKKAHAKSFVVNNNGFKGHKKQPMSTETLSTPSSNCGWSFTQPMSTTDLPEPSSLTPMSQSHFTFYSGSGLEKNDTPRESATKNLFG